MSRSVTLYPLCEGWEDPSVGTLGEDRLRVGSWDDLMNPSPTAVRKPHPLPPGQFFIYSNKEGSHKTTTDAFGDPLTFLYAGELSAYIFPRPPRNTLHGRDKAIASFIRDLPPATPIVLFWR